MPIETRCPQCGKGYHVAEGSVGKTVQCKQCERKFEVQPVQAANAGSGAAALPSTRRSQQSQSQASRPLAGGSAGRSAPPPRPQDRGGTFGPPPPTMASPGMSPPGMSPPGMAPPYDSVLDNCGAFRSGKKLVMERDAELPERCIMTNGPADGGEMKRKVSWYPPVILIGLFLGVLPVLLLALLTEKKATVYFPLSKKAINRRRKLIAATWLCFLGSIAMIFIAVAVERGPMITPLMITMGVGLLVSLCLATVVSSSLPRATRIDDQYVTLRGVHKDYLAELPQF